jgi:hypothetical protein
MTTISLFMMLTLFGGIEPQTAADVAGMDPVSELSVSDGGAATALQIPSSRARRALVRHAQPLSSHTVGMADMGLLQLPKHHADYGSQADSCRRVAADIFSQHLL